MTLLITPTADPSSSLLTIEPTWEVTVTLSEILIFLQELLLEYEETDPDWKYSRSQVTLMNDVRYKLAAAESTLTPPVFDEQEIMWLQETILEYEETHSDWRRWSSYFNRWSDFNAALTIQSLVSSEVPGTPLPISISTETFAVSSGTGGNTTGIRIPPPAD